MCNVTLSRRSLLMRGRQGGKLWQRWPASAAFRFQQSTLVEQHRRSRGGHYLRQRCDIENRFGLHFGSAVVVVKWPKPCEATRAP